MSPKPNLDAAAVSAFMASRRSTRDFLSTPVPEDVLNEIITDALTAASWSNTRPFMVGVASGEKRQRISAEFLKRWAALSAARVGGLLPKIRLALTRYGVPTSHALIARPYPNDLKPRSQRIGKEMYAHIGVARGDKVERDAQWARNYDFFGAPTELFIYMHKHFGVFSAADAGLFVSQLMLSAHARGLGTCAQGAVSIWADAVDREFDVPKGYKLLYGVAIGYPSDAHINDFAAHRIGADEIKLKGR